MLKQTVTITLSQALEFVLVHSMAMGDGKGTKTSNVTRRDRASAKTTAKGKKGNDEEQPVMLTELMKSHFCNRCAAQSSRYLARRFFENRFGLFDCRDCGVLLMHLVPQRPPYTHPTETYFVASSAVYYDGW